MDRQILINDVYYPLLTDQSRYLILWGSAGSGKSIFAGQKLIARCLTEPGHRFLCARKVGKSIKDSIFTQIYNQLSDIDLIGRVTVNKTNMSFHFPNGSEIITTGLDDTEKLKSIYGITGMWIEEATELDKADFDQLDMRLRGETKFYKQIILSFNPVDESHWIKAEFFDREVAGCRTLNTTYKDNKFIDEEYVRVLNDRVAADENLYRIYVLGLWGRVRTGIEYYTAFSYKQHVKPCAYDKESYLHLTFDQNVAPYYSALSIQIAKEYDDSQKPVYVVRVLREFALSNPFNKADQVARKILEAYPEPAGIFMYGDASGNKQDTRNAKNDYQIMSHLFRAYLNNTSDRTLRVNPPHRKRRQFINAILLGKLPVRVEIDPECKLLIADLEVVKEDADGGVLKERTKDKHSGQTYEKYGHLSDAFCYFLINAFRGMYDSFKYYADR